MRGTPGACACMCVCGVRREGGEMDREEREAGKRTGTIPWSIVI